MSTDKTSSDAAAAKNAAEDALLRYQRLDVASGYAGAIMHEVNNSLEALTNLVFLAKMAGGENVRQYLEIAETELKRLGEITRKSLSFYREEAEAREIDLIGVAESALVIHAHRIGEQKIVLRKRVRTPATAKVFANEILQVISNLIVNSLDAMSESDGILSVRVRSCPVRVHITVADNGMGIAPAIHERLFEANRTNKANGTGFGLWLAKSIVEKHGGTITCRSSQKSGHRGTTFRVCVPISGGSAKAA